LSPRWLGATFWIALYGTFVNWAGTLLAAVWGTGRTTPIAAPGRSGTAMQEGVVDFLLISLSFAMVAVCVLVLWGLRSRRGAPVLLLLLSMSTPSALRATDPEAQSTFVRDVAPILYRRCLACHRAGEMAPMSLVTWDEVRPWVKAIRNVVARGEMPPWHADPRYGPYREARGLDESERRMLLGWIDAGAPRGDGDPPTPPVFVAG
jgi:hypothetical protein